MTAKEAAAYLKHGRRFVLREIHAGRLRAALVGGRREVLTRSEWCDAWATDQARPVMFQRRTG
jgi:excisionase family DNA binding protein